MFLCNSCGEEVKVIIRNSDKIFIHKEEY